MTRPRRRLARAAALLLAGSLSAVVPSPAPARTDGASAAVAAVEVRSAASASGAGTTTLTVPLPPGTSSGDVLLATLVARRRPQITAPGGWALVRSDLGTGMKVSSYVRVASAGEPTSYTWTFGRNTPAAGGILALTGVDTASPIDAHAGAVGTTRGTAVRAPSITVASAGSLLVGSFGVRRVTSIAPPAGMAERWDRSSTAGSKNVTSAAATEALAAAGPTGERVATAGAADYWVGQLVALAPAQEPEPEPVTVAAAGDIACDPTNPAYNGGLGTATLCRQLAVSDILVDGGFDAVLTLGDNQYENGALSKFQESYDPSWGRVKGITYPSVGNHEYQISGATGYFDYFGAAAGERGKGYYSFDLGGWHLIALNSNCSKLSFGSGTDGCAEGSPQNDWLETDLASSAATCTIAYWHHARFSSGPHGDEQDAVKVRAFWVDLYEAGADVVLVSHDHLYERFAPQDPDAVADPAGGIRQFVVGTGGDSRYGVESIKANSEVRNTTTYGILSLTLHAGSYDWAFVHEAGASFTDAGSGTCH